MEVLQSWGGLTAANDLSHKEQHVLLFISIFFFSPHKQNNLESICTGTLLFSVLNSSIFRGSFSKPVCWHFQSSSRQNTQGEREDRGNWALFPVNGSFGTFVRVPVWLCISAGPSSFPVFSVKWFNFGGLRRWSGFLDIFRVCSRTSDLLLFLPE